MIASLLLVYIALSVFAWYFLKVDPLTQVARGAIWTRTAIKVGVYVGRDSFKWWLAETRRSYETNRVAEGCN